MAQQLFEASPASAARRSLNSVSGFTGRRTRRRRSWSCRNRSARSSAAAGRAAEQDVVHIQVAVDDRGGQARLLQERMVAAEWVIIVVAAADDRALARTRRAGRSAGGEHRRASRIGSARSALRARSRATLGRRSRIVRQVEEQLGRPVTSMPPAGRASGGSHPSTMPQGRRSSIGTVAGGRIHRDSRERIDRPVPERSTMRKLG